MDNITDFDKNEEHLIFEPSEIIALLFLTTIVIVRKEVQCAKLYIIPSYISLFSLNIFILCILIYIIALNIRKKEIYILK